MRPPTHLGWTLGGLYTTIQNRGGHVTLSTRLPTVNFFSCPRSGEPGNEAKANLLAMTTAQLSQLTRYLYIASLRSLSASF